MPFRVGASIPLEAAGPGSCWWHYDGCQVRGEVGRSYFEIRAGRRSYSAKNCRSYQKNLAGAPRFGRSFRGIYFRMSHLYVKSFVTNQKTRFRGSLSIRVLLRQRALATT